MNTHELPGDTESNFIRYTPSISSRHAPDGVKYGKKFVRVRRVVVVVGDDDSEFDDNVDLAAVLELFTNVQGVQSIVALTLR